LKERRQCFADINFGLRPELMKASSPTRFTGCQGSRIDPGRGGGFSAPPTVSALMRLHPASVSVGRLMEFHPSRQDIEVTHRDSPAADPSQISNCMWFVMR
jgi:hypothetical protein